MRGSGRDSGPRIPDPRAEHRRVEHLHRIGVLHARRRRRLTMPPVPRQAQHTSEDDDRREEPVLATQEEVDPVSEEAEAEEGQSLDLVDEHEEEERR